MIVYHMRVAQGHYQFIRFQVGELGNDMQEKSVGSDIERHSEKHIGTSLVHMHRVFTARNEKLKYHVAGRLGHLVKLAWIQSAHNQACMIWILFYSFYNLLQLVFFFTIRFLPMPPLDSVDSPQVAFVFSLRFPIICVAIRIPDVATQAV